MSNKHIGSSFDSFLKEEGLLDEVVSMVSIQACKMCGEYKPKLDERTGRFGCFYCAPVRVPRFS